MSNRTCLWDEGCGDPMRSSGLCGRHAQNARKRGLIDHYRHLFLASRVCEECGLPIAVDRKSTARFCSKRCVSAEYRRSASSPSMKRSRQREYARNHYARERAKLLASIGERTCPECGSPLPEGSRLRRVYCSRRCINQVSLRERKWQRRASTERRRLLLLGAEHKLVTESEWQSLVRRFGGRCAYCGSICVATKDHVIPVSRGGRHAIGNLVPACLSCNSSKGNRLLADWRLRSVRADRLAA